MDRIEYDFLCERLRKPEDIPIIAEQLGLPQPMLYNILSNRIVRHTMRSYHRINARLEQLYAEWQSGRSVISIARRYAFPPALLMRMLLKRMGLSRNEINDFMRHPEKLKGRLAEEVRKAVESDFIYSPWAAHIQTANGAAAEAAIARWLDAKGLRYTTEAERKGAEKTPDFLLESPLKVDGFEINWIESKASFGDEYEIRRNWRRQLSRYVELFGPGMVCYWWGYLDDISLPGVLIVDRHFFGGNDEL